MSAAPGVHRRRQFGAGGGGEAGAAEQFGDALALGFGMGWLGRPAGGGQYAALVGDGGAAAQQLHGEVPHGFEAQREAGEVLAAEAAGFGLQALDGAGDIDGGQVVVQGGAVRRGRRNAAALAHARGGGVGVGEGQGLIGEPGIRNETTRAGGAHHVAAPERIHAQNGVAGQLVETRAHWTASFNLVILNRSLTVAAR